MATSAHATDTVVYSLHPKISGVHLPSAETIEKYAFSLLDNLSRPWIWNSAKFSLKENYEGSTHFGASVEDEWVVVWMLFEVSKKWNVAVKVEDEDGEFLLIEAAEGLEGWTEPGNTENRVYIYQGKLHIIPPNVHALEDPLSVSQAVSLLSPSTLAPKLVQSIISTRISGFPKKLVSHLHRTLAYLPPTISHLLNLDPQLIARTVHAFADRAVSKRRLNPRFRPVQFGEELLCKVDMTRVLFAEVVGSGEHYPDKMWRENGWSTEPHEGDKKRWMEVGLRVVAGFEEAYERSRRESSGDKDEAEFKRTVKRLEKQGYFEGELEGSKRWKELEERVRVGFEQRRERRKEDTEHLSFADEVDHLLEDSNMPPMTSIAEIPSSKDEDSLSWLEMSPEHLDQLLSQYQSTSIKKPSEESMDVDGLVADEEEKMVQAEVEKLERFAKEVEGFVEKGKGDWEGARFKEEESDDEEEEEEEYIRPTVDEFRAAQDKLVEPLPPSEWGQKSHASDLAQSKDSQGTGEESKSQPSRPNILTKESYDGVVSDSDSDVGGDEGDIFAEGGNEMMEFLQFAKETLGIGEEQWQGIIEERKGRGAFIPPEPRNWTDNKEGESKKRRERRKVELPTDEEMVDHVEKTRDEPPPISLIPNRVQPSSSKIEPTSSQSIPKTKQTSYQIPDILPKDHPLLNQDSMKVLDALLKKVEEDDGPKYQPSKTKARDVKNKMPPMDQRNPELNSFEALMDAMDKELEKQRTNFSRLPSQQGKSPQSLSPDSPLKKEKEKQKASVLEEAEDSDDDEAAMDEEFANLIQMEGMDEMGDVDVNMVKNLLQSLKAQVGGAGPVGNLAGRLGVGDLAMDVD